MLKEAARKKAATISKHMRLCDLVQSLRWPDVKASLLWSYADAAESLDGYQLVWAKLRALAPVKSNMRIIVKETF